MRRALIACLIGCAFGAVALGADNKQAIATCQQSHAAAACAYTLR